MGRVKFYPNQTNVLSEYLKNLQRLGLVEKDTESRKYRARLPITEQVLFFNEVLEFVKSQFEKSIKSGNERAGIISSPIGWVVMTEASEQSRFIEKRLKEPENSSALETVSRIIEDSWKEYYFSNLDKNNRHIRSRVKIIETYKQYLREIFELLYPWVLPEKNEKLFAELFEFTKKEMVAAHPEINVPEEMIQLETKRRLKKFAERHATIMTPASLEDLHTTLEIFETLKNQSRPRKGPTEKEMQQIEKRTAYLKDSKNKKIYEEHLNRLSNVPKSLIFYPSWGFKGYPQKIMDMIPKQNQ